MGIYGHIWNGDQDHPVEIHNVYIAVSAWELHCICVYVLEMTDNVRFRIGEVLSWLFISSAY